MVRIICSVLTYQYDNIIMLLCSYYGSYVLLSEEMKKYKNTYVDLSFWAKLKLLLIGRWN